MGVGSVHMRVASNLPDHTEQLIRKVIGAAIEVHRHLGPGFLETIYEQALCREFDMRQIRYVRQKEIIVLYKGFKLTGQRLDLLVEDTLILELKAVEQINPIHEAQILSYLTATGLHAGLIINFRVKQLKDGIKRVVQ
jgi:GxxExxY protein